MMLAFVPSSGPGVAIRPSEAALLVGSEIGNDCADAYAEAKGFLLRGLRDGNLTAHVYLIKDGRFFQVPVEYWQMPGDLADLRVSDHLFSFSDEGVPPLLDNAVVLLERHELEPLIAAARPAAAADDAVPHKYQTKNRPPWYPVLRTKMLKEHERLVELAERKPDMLPPQFPTAARFRRQLLAKGFPEARCAPSVVRYHVANIKKELGR